MRVTCEACGARQPPDFTFGQRCTTCGGAVREETRCAACARWTPQGKFCRHCAAALVPAQDYGAARMLLQAGVDRLSLAERVRALDPEQKAAFASRFASQRALVAARVEDVRFVEQHLFTTGHADRLEDTWVASLPWGDGGDGVVRPAGVDAADVDERLRALRGVAWDLGHLALLASVHRGAGTESELWQVYGLLDAQGEPDVQLEAALALTLTSALDRRGTRFGRTNRWNEFAQAAFKRAPGGLTALAWAGALEEAHGAEAVTRALVEDASLRQALEGARAHEDPRLRLCAARNLGDELALAVLLDYADERVAQAALRALAERKSEHVVARLERARTAAERLPWLSSLRGPLSDRAFRAVVATLGDWDPVERRRALQLLERTPFDDVDPGARAPLEAWLSSAPPLEENEARELAAWALETKASAAPFRDGPWVAPYVDAVSRVLDPQGENLSGAWGWRGWLAHGDVPSAHALLLGWLRQPDTAGRVLSALFSEASVLASYAQPKDDRAHRLFLRLWDALGDDGRAALAPTLADGLRRETGSSAFQTWLDLLWERFLTHPTERGPLWRATWWVRAALAERWAKDERARALDGGSALRRFECWADWDLEHAPEALQAALADAPDADDWRSAGPSVFDRASALLRAGEHRRAYWLASQFAAFVVNHFRDAEHRERFRPAARALGPLVDALHAARAQHAPRDAADDIRGLVEHVDTELRLAREVEEREADERARAAERAAERERREAERRAEAERHAAEEQARAQEAQERLEQAQAAVAQAAQAQAAAGDDALDHQALVDGPVRTLAQYAALMRALRGGADVMALFAQYELTPATWGACAAAWSQVMTARMDVALRFMKLLG